MDTSNLTGYLLEYTTPNCTDMFLPLDRPRIRQNSNLYGRKEYHIRHIHISYGGDIKSAQVCVDIRRTGASLTEQSISDSLTRLNYQGCRARRSRQLFFIDIITSAFFFQGIKHRLMHSKLSSMAFLVEVFKERHYDYSWIASDSGGFTRARLLLSVS